ncbi:MAG: hypothetical protein ACOCXA_06615 [Planctomycetota bacterium]
MHEISHHGNDPQRLQEYRRINRYHVGQLARVLGRMQAIDEGGSSMLDNTVLLFGSTMGDGDSHDGNHLPLLLCGGRNCELRPGRRLVYEKMEDRRLCNLHLALARRMGLNVDQVGNSHYALPGLA